MDSFQDTNIEAYNHPFVEVHVIVVVADAFAFVVAYDQTSAVVFDPMALELVDLSLIEKQIVQETNTFIELLIFASL